jgi:hypothetical protein
MDHRRGGGHEPVPFAFAARLERAQVYVVE